MGVVIGIFIGLVIIYLVTRFTMWAFMAPHKTVSKDDTQWP